MPYPRQKDHEFQSREPHLPEVIHVVGNPSSELLYKWTVVQSTPILQHGSLEQEGIWGRCPKGLIYAYPPQHYTTSSWMIRGWEGPDNDHAILAGLELVPR